MIKYIRIFGGLFIILIAIETNAQSKQELLIIDTLKQQLANPISNEKLLITLNNLCIFTVNYHPDQALMYADSGLRLARTSKLDKYACLFYQNKGEVYRGRGDNKRALIEDDSSYSVASKYGINLVMRNVTNDIGAIYEQEGNFALAQNYFFKSLSLAEDADDKQLIRLCYTNICVVYGSEKNFGKAVFYANKVLDLCKDKPNPHLEAKAYEAIGSAYDNRAEHDKAKAYYNKALEIYRQSQDKLGMANMYTLLSATYVNQPGMQLQLNLKAKEIYDNLSPNSMYAILNTGYIGLDYDREAYLDMKTTRGPTPLSDKLFHQAQDYLSKSVNAAKAANIKDAIIALADSLASVNAVVGKYKEAYLNLKYRIKVNDSVYSQENKNKIASLEGRHEIELKNKLLKINELEITYQQKQKWFLTGGLLTLIFIAGLIYYQYYQRKKINTSLVSLNNNLDEANKIKTRFFNILNHDLRSPVAGFVHFLQQQNTELMEAEKRKAYTDNAIQLAENLLNNMEDLLLWSKGQMKNFKPNIKPVAVDKLFENILNAITLPPNIHISLGQEPGIKLNTDEHYIKTIILNLTNNSVKALGNTVNGTIHLKAWSAGNKQYLAVSDNGPGSAKETFMALYDDKQPVGIKHGLGLHIVRDLAKAINCKVSVQSFADSGTQITIAMS